VKAVVTLGVIWAFIVPSNLISIAINHKTACPLQKGRTYLSGTYSTYSSDHFWNASGKKCNAYNTFEKKVYHLYAEYGLSRRDTIWIQSAWARIEESINGRSFGFEDVEIGWKHDLGTTYSHHISCEIVGIIPIATKYEPGLRYGVYGGEINVLFTKGVRLWEQKGSYDLRLGYRKYCGFPSDQLRADAVINVLTWSRLCLSAGGFLEYGLFNGESKKNESFFLFNSNYRLLSGQVQATFSLYKAASLFIGYQRHLWGRNVGTKGGAYGGLQVLF